MAYDIAAVNANGLVPGSPMYASPHREAVDQCFFRAMETGIVPNYIDDGEAEAKGADFLKQWKVIYCPKLAYAAPAFRKALEGCIAAGRLYVPVFFDNKLHVVDAADGKMLNSVDVPSPRGVAAHGDSIYLLSETKLLKLDRDAKTHATLIADGLDDPSGLAVDADGTIYVADGGRSQQVKVFSPAGKPLRRIGIDGGRPRNGICNPAAMLDPRGLCLGPDGTLWVAEANDFQRLSVWNARSGKLIREFFNTSISSGQGRIDPSRSEMVFSSGVYSDAPGLRAYKIDLKKGTWYPLWTRVMQHSQMKQDAVFLGNTHIYNQQAKAFEGTDGVARCPYLAFTDGTHQGHSLP